MNALRIGRRITAYVWAGPNTLLGLMVGLLVLGLGGRAQFVRGVVEFHGGLMGRICIALPGALRFSAITFGHVILGGSAATMVAVREHEHVHVRQYEAWGPFFLLAYSASSAWELLQGRCPYRDNYFERCACAATGLPTHGRPPGGSAIRGRPAVLCADEADRRENPRVEIAPGNGGRDNEGPASPSIRRLNQLERIENADHWPGHHPAVFNDRPRSLPGVIDD